MSKCIVLMIVSLGFFATLQLLQPYHQPLMHLATGKVRACQVVVTICVSKGTITRTRYVSNLRPKRQPRNDIILVMQSFVKTLRTVPVKVQVSGSCQKLTQIAL